MRFYKFNLNPAFDLRWLTGNLHIIQHHIRVRTALEKFSLNVLI